MRDEREKGGWNLSDLVKDGKIYMVFGSDESAKIIYRVTMAC